VNADALSRFNDLIVQYATNFGLKILGAVALWIVGGIFINVISGMASRSMKSRKVDATLVIYITATIRVAMRIALVIAILSVFGIETTSFAALIAAAGIAIGAAWSGLLSNFAAGTFLMILRPFKVGDMITAGGVTGDVVEIGLFATTIHTVDNLRVIVGNTKILADNVINYHATDYRRVDLTAQLAAGVDPYGAIAGLKTEVQKISNIMGNPAPSIEILEFNQYGTKLAVRPFCNNQHYWQVFFDTNKAIQNVGAAAGYPQPAVRQINTGG
jgi:small conductance mechanosensitive channel